MSKRCADCQRKATHFIAAKHEGKDITLLCDKHYERRAP